MGYCTNMTALLEKVGEMIGKMNRSEKAQILQWVVSDLGDAFPGIDYSEPRFLDSMLR